MSDNFSYLETDDYHHHSSSQYQNPQMYEFISDQNGPFGSQEPFSRQNHERHDSPDNRTTDDFTNDSNSSLNYSPNYQESNDQHSSDHRSEADTARHTRVPPILKKGIQKMYEPLVDNNVIYDYDKDPEEYKKARKRVQNRESATRVRNKKKNHVEEIESEMDVMKRENANLKVENATLRAENSLLRQQTQFLEKMVMNTNSNNNNSVRMMPSAAPTHFMDRNYEECLLPMVDKADKISDSTNLGYFRAAPPHTFKKHATMLAVFTALLCVYGIIGSGSSTDNGIVYPSNMNEFRKGFAPRPQEVDNDIDAYQNNEYNKVVEGLLQAQQNLDRLYYIGKWSVGIGYVVYMIYVLLIANWKYVFKMKSMKNL